MIGRAGLLLLALVAARDDPLAGRVAGPSADCIEIDRVGCPDVVDDHTILYRENARRVWRTGPVGTCSSMRTGDQLIVTLYGRRLCQNDRFLVRSADVVLGGSCRFDRFTPFDKAG